jgi:hypothetical protein
MADTGEPGGGNNYEDRLGINDQRDTTLQIILSLVLGISAFLAFCVRSPYCANQEAHLTVSTRFSDRNGQAYMRQERSKRVAPMCFQIYQTPIWAGCQ